MIPNMQLSIIITAKNGRNILNPITNESVIYLVMAASNPSQSKTAPPIGITENESQTARKIYECISEISNNSNTR